MLNKLRIAIGQLGMTNGLLYLTDRLLHAISGGRARLIRYLLVAQPVPQVAPDTSTSVAKNPVRQVGNQDPIVARFPRPAQVIATRFGSGAMCLVAEVRDRFAGFIWLAFDGYDEDEVRCRFEFVEPDHCAWDFDVYVEPEFRMGRTFFRLWQAANKELSARGVRWSYSRISAFNAASVAAHNRMGLQYLHGATFIRVGGLQLAFIGAPPYMHLSLTENSRPVVRLGLPLATQEGGDPH